MQITSRTNTEILYEFTLTLNKAEFEKLHKEILTAAADATELRGQWLGPMLRTIQTEMEAHI